IDPTIVDTTDEVGRATLVAQVPGSVYGQQNLIITTPTGTTATQPVFLKAPSTIAARDIARTARAGARYEVKAAVRAPLAIAGTVAVAVDGVTVSEFAYTPRRGATSVEATFVMPTTLAKGAHTVTLSYSGSSTLLASTTSFTITVR
ncbi:MAG: hypothetical protein ACOYMR_16565, partial [Ilumatobacteraceae bacterium]